MENQSMIDNYRQMLKRIAWRLQYQAKKVDRHESVFEDVWTKEHMGYVDSDLFVKELLSSPPDRGRFILQKVVIEGIPEREVAKQLNISQKRVNVCKTKYLQQLRQKLISD
jgi:DNA-directed RNA polymerase specialized sigma subunit